MAKARSASKVPGNQEQKDRLTADLGRAIAFLNFPYDPSYDDIWIAHITGLLILGIQPTILSLDTSDSLRLSKLISALQGSTLSIHDLSFDSEPHRLKRRLSDYNGFDPWVHENTTQGSHLEELHTRAKTWRSTQRGELREAAVFRRTVDAISKLIQISAI